jgi:hypothetical protein
VETGFPKRSCSNKRITLERGDAALVIKNPSRKTSPIRYMKPDERDVLERQA